MMCYAVRPMRVDDIPQVAEIERESFPTPWSATSFRRELVANRLADYLVAWDPRVGSAQGTRLDRLCSRVRQWFSGDEHVAGSGQLIVGYIGLWFMVDEAHLTTIAVREAYRQQGIGELLLSSVIDLAVERGARFITLEVRGSNLAAQALYEKYGFNRVGLRRGYYTDDGEDAVLMATNGITSALFQMNFQRLKRALAQR